MLRQALLNLMRNAVEAAAGQDFGARVTVHGSKEHGAAKLTQRISIADNGPGIPQEDLPKVFLPFFTTKAQGTGLGLAIVQKIIVQHGGTVEARNLSEGGAEFVVWLPRAPEHAGSGGLCHRPLHEFSPQVWWNEFKGTEVRRRAGFGKATQHHGTSQRNDHRGRRTSSTRRGSRSAAPQTQSSQQSGAQSSQTQAPSSSTDNTLRLP